MSTEAERDTSLPGMVGLNLLFHSHDAVQTEVFIVISTTNGRCMIRQKASSWSSWKQNPDPGFSEEVTFCGTNVYYIWIQSHNTLAYYLKSTDHWKCFNLLTQDSQYRHIDLFRQTFPNWTSNICFTNAVHPAEVIHANKNKEILSLSSWKKRAVLLQKYLFFPPRAAQLICSLPVSRLTCKPLKGVQTETFLWCITLE